MAQYLADPLQRIRGTLIADSEYNVMMMELFLDIELMSGLLSC